MAATKAIRKLEHVIDPYDWSVFIAIGEEEYDTLMSMCPGDETMLSLKGKAGGMVPMEGAEESGIDFCVVFINEVNIATIVHESVHAIHYMMKMRGIPCTYECTEVLAYHVDHLVTEVIKRAEKGGHTLSPC